MGKTKGKRRLDKFYHLAKEQGFRSRAAFKLTQLDAKFRILHSARSVLDLCAAPGGWMQVVVSRVPVGSLVLGVDLVPIRPVRGALSLIGDVTTEKCRSSIRRIMKENGCAAFDVVLHDGSPNIGGNWASEATSQAALVISSVKLAAGLLAPNGTFLTKIFRSQDYTAILYCLKQLFEKVEVTKPVASRSTSAEIYAVGQRYKAPVKIDPRLLDIKYLFQGSIEPAKVPDVIRGTKQKRNREGYEDGISILRKVCLASDFVWSETPLDILGSVTSISFDDSACSLIKDNSLTTEEIKILCDDLRVLGKHDFKNLLKWRMQLRKALSPTQGIVHESTALVRATPKGNEDDIILNEMEELAYLVERRKKRAKKLKAKRQAKDKIRKSIGKQIDVMEDGYQDNELFSLSSIKHKKQLESICTEELSDVTASLKESEDEDHSAGHQEHSPSAVDTDDEFKQYDAKLEEFLDHAYENFVARKEGNTQQKKHARLTEPRESEDISEGVQEVDALQLVDDVADGDDVVDEGNPLLVHLHAGARSSQDQLIDMWFSQDVFTEGNEEFQNNDSDEDNILEDKNANQEIPEKSSLNSKDLELSSIQSTKCEGFEIVPAVTTDSGDASSSSDDSEIDDDAKPEILAYAKKMLRKKQREQILDDAYNKYMFDDVGLPRWFVEDEKKHCQPVKPITKEEITAMKAHFREIDARPSKKVAEAKARKKRAALIRLEKVRRKANSLSDQTDLSERSKAKMIDKLYKKAIPRKRQKEYVLAKKGVKVKVGKGQVLVDRRMKKDARSRGCGMLRQRGFKSGNSAKGRRSAREMQRGKRHRDKGKNQ